MKKLKGIKIDLPSDVHTNKLIQKLRCLGFTDKNNFNYRLLSVSCLEDVQYATIDDNYMVKLHSDFNYSCNKFIHTTLSSVLSIPNPLMGFDRFSPNENSLNGESHLFSISNYDVYGNIANLGYETDYFNSMYLNNFQRNRDLSVYYNGKAIQDFRIKFDLYIGFGNTYLCFGVNDLDNNVGLSLCFDEEDELANLIEHYRKTCKNAVIDKYFFKLFLEEFQKQNFKMVLLTEEMCRVNDFIDDVNKLFASS